MLQDTSVREFKNVQVRPSMRKTDLNGSSDAIYSTQGSRLQRSSIQETSGHNTTNATQDLAMQREGLVGHNVRYEGAVSDDTGTWAQSRHSLSSSSSGYFSS